MRFFVDECCSQLLCDFLKRKKNNVVYGATVLPGANDDTVDAYARKEERILISSNVKDFFKSKYRIKNTPGKILIAAIEADKQMVVLEKIMHKFQNYTQTHFKILKGDCARLRKYLEEHPELPEDKKKLIEEVIAAKTTENIPANL